MCPLRASPQAHQLLRAFHTPRPSLLDRRTEAAQRLSVAQLYSPWLSSVWCRSHVTSTLSRSSRGGRRGGVSRVYVTPSQTWHRVSLLVKSVSAISAAASTCVRILEVTLPVTWPTLLLFEEERVEAVWRSSVSDPFLRSSEAKDGMSSIDEDTKTLGRLGG